jgi:hypothetical protein
MGRNFSTSKEVEAVRHARLLSLRDLVAVYGLTTWFWRTCIWRGDIPHLQLGRKLVVDQRDIEAFIEKNKVIEGAR